MERFKLFIKRFAGEDDIRMTVGIVAANNTKSEAMKVVAALDDIESSVDGTIKSLDNLPSSGRVALSQLKSAIQDLLKSSKQLDEMMTKVGASGNVTSGFSKAKSALSGKSTLKEAKIGFTGGASTDQSQLLKEVEYLYSNILNKIKLINGEEEKQIKNADKIIAGLAQENALTQQQQVKTDFQQSYTTVSGNPELTAQYREQYSALMALLTPQQQDAVIKKLMNEESRKLVNNTVEEIKALKEQAIYSNRNVSGIDKLRGAVNRLNAASDAGKKKFKDFVDEFKKAAVTWRIVGGTLRSIINTFANLYDSAASYEEALNLYTVALGGYAEQATQWSNRISEALYLDPKNIMQYTGAFYNLVQGLGATSEAAYLMSTNLTQLSYDMSSYLNIDVESAQAKIQSAITGQSRAVASAGIAMQQASLQELAYSLGIQKNVADMTQAEKTYLRYIQIMRSTANMQGDLARTIITPENALRVIRTQFTLLGRAIGQVFIPIVLKAIPYIMLLVQALQKLATWLGAKLGYKIADIDYSSISMADTYMENLGDTAADTAGKVKGAAASINRSLAPFDNLNVVETESAGGGGAAGGGIGGDSVIGDLTPFLEGYDMLAGLTDDFNKQLDKARENLKKMLPWVIAIGGALLGWKLTKGFMNAIIAVADFMKAWAIVGPKIGTTFSAIGKGLVGLFNASLLSDLPAAFAAIAGSIKAVLAGTMTLGEAWSIFILPALQTIAGVLGGIALTIAGVFKFVQGIKDILSSNVFKGIVKVIEGIAMVVSGIALLFGGWIVAAVAAVTAVVAAVVEHWEVIKEFFVGLWEGVSGGFITAWNAIVEFFTPAIEWMGETIATIAQFFVDLWNGMVDVFGGIANWLKAHVFQPIINLFTPIVTWFGGIFVGIFDLLFGIVTNIIGLIRGTWETITIVFGVVANWFNEHVIKPVAKFFKGLWEGVKTAAVAAWDGIKVAFSVVGGWIYDKVISPVANFFTFLWNGFVNGAKTAWESVKKVFSTVATFFGNVFSEAWEKVRAVFSIMGTIFQGIAEGIFNVFAKVVNFIIGGINNVIKVPFEAINKALRKIKNIEIAGYQPFYDKIKEITIPQIPKIEGYATGGYPTSGDLFFANENGRAEYITSVGNRTAVANQDQMTTAITNAILAGMQSIQTERGITQVYIGNDKVYEGQGEYQNRQAERYGTTFIKV